MTIYNVLLGQINFRCNYHRFKGIIPDSVNSALYYLGVGSMISGPMIGYFDRYSDVHTHSIFTAIYVICQVVYLANFSYILNKNSDKFEGKGGQIQLMSLFNKVVLVVGGISLYYKIMGIKIGGYSAMIEWVVFESSMAMHNILAYVVDYREIVIPSLN